MNRRQQEEHDKLLQEANKIIQSRKPETEPKSSEEPMSKEEKKEVVQEVQKEVGSPVVLISEMDAYIMERQKSQPKTLEAIETKIERDWDKPKHALELPEDFKEHEKKFAFRWLNKKKRSIDHAIDVIGWNFVNRTLFPSLPKHLFTANGSIERGDAILSFMPLKRAEELRLKPAKLSRERVRNTPVQRLDRWEQRGENQYKPDLGSSEGESDAEYAKSNRGIVRVPDTDIVEVEK